MVTLPKVKGESAAQRNDRVAREKTAALVRQCDFCAPSVALLEPQPAAMNGSHVDAPALETDVSTAIADLSVIVPDEPETPPEADAEPVAIPAEPVVDVIPIEPEPSEPEVPHELVIEAVIASHIEETVEPEAPASEPKPARGRRARRAPARRTTPRRAPVVSSQRFRVEYQVERVVRAATVQAALRQVSALGAADVVAITRED
jgi:hypothetical protein